MDKVDGKQENDDFNVSLLNQDDDYKEKDCNANLLLEHDERDSGVEEENSPEQSENVQEEKMSKKRLGLNVLWVFIASSICVTLLIVIAISWFSTSKVHRSCEFDLLILGSRGGITEDDLTTYGLRIGNDQYMALGAGTLVSAVKRFLESNVNAQGFVITNHNLRFTFPPELDIEQRAIHFVRYHLAGYFIGHSHFDHFAGLVHASPLDYRNISSGISKVIFSHKETIQDLEQHVFNGKLWPRVPWYNFHVLPQMEWFSLKDILQFNGTSHRVMLFPLCHDTLNSSALLIQNENQAQFLYFSDTGPPTSQVSCSFQKRIEQIWENPNLSIERLLAIVIEISFPNSHPDDKLYGHMRPKEVLQLLSQLQEKRGSLKHITVFLTHQKPDLTLDRTEIGMMILESLRKDSSVEVKNFILAQGITNDNSEQYHCIN